MYVKICGLRDQETALCAVSAGADAVGVVMSERSPRHATVAEASAVVSFAKRYAPEVDTVLVTNVLPAAEAASFALELGFDVLQLHGSYSSADIRSAQRILPRIWRAVSLTHFPDAHPGEFGEERLLIDSAVPGSGLPWDRSLLQSARFSDGWILAGGLSPANVADAIVQTSPWGVDVSSGVEIPPGVKDRTLIEEFVRAAKGVPDV